mgnify:CR=1 FL=1
MMIPGKAMQKEIDRIRALTSDLALNEQEQRIINWICEQDLWTAEAVAGIIEKAKGRKQ